MSIRVFLSHNHNDKPFVRKLARDLENQISGKKIKVLPIMLKECEPPGFLIGKLYADFRNKDNYVEAFKRLIQSIGMVFNKNVMSDKKTSTPV
ncbi:TPA: hypothetical protein JFW75_000927 [Salmonella enterica]|nr:hypothetical protein [Salmonella enterica]